MTSSENGIATATINVVGGFFNGIWITGGAGGNVLQGNFVGTNECHGWVGLRFQAEPGGEPNTIILHINMLDDSALAQQESVGVLGVNLIYAAFKAEEGPIKGLDPEELEGTLTFLAGVADDLDNKLADEFGARLYTEGPDGI